MTTQLEPLGFDDSDHELTYALFIIEANWIISGASRFEGVDEKFIITHVIFCYWNQWEDRAIADVEFEGWVSDGAIKMSKEDDIGSFQVSGKGFSWGKNNKIKFRFVEDA